MKKAEDILREAGLRVTQQRLQILDFLSGKQGPVILHLLHSTFEGKINRITLYRILNGFEAAGLVKLFFAHDGQKRIEWTGPHATSTIPHEEHLHFQCKKCDKVFCLDDVEVRNLPKGFNLSSDQSVLVGSCSHCE